MLTISAPGERPIAAEAGMRVARWHETYPGSFDPVPGTIARVGLKFLTVDFDGTGEHRVLPDNVTPWSEPRED